MAHDDVMSEIGEVRLALDLPKLQAFAATHLPQLRGAELRAKQFSTGTSNPTYLVWSASDERERFVLRRKPGGKLLPGAHQIDREYQVMKALGAYSVPVPRMIAYCDDAGVIGAPFYLMECVAGRVLTDNGASLAPAERHELWDSINLGMVAMHSVDFRAAGLTDYGKVGNYAERQVRTWGKQYDAADRIVAPELKRPELTQSMHKLRDYLLVGMAVLQPEPTCVVHGDLGLHNMLIHPTAPRVAAFLDWEISTLGHPLIDLDYVSSVLPGGWRSDTSFPGDGAPTQGEFMDAYCKRRGWPAVPQAAADFAALVNMFRSCAIVHGVLARGLSGNAASGTTRNEIMQEMYIGVLRKAMKVLARVERSSKL